jgi:hypothetical protein
MRANFMFIPFFLVVVLLTSFKKDNEVPRSPIKILFLGNSITKHSPAPDLGWYGDWGMAATSEDKDFVHLLVGKLKFEAGLNIDFKVQNIASWERDFNDTTNFKVLRDYNADIIVIRLGENIDVDYAKKNNYQLALEKLIKYLVTDGTKGVVVSNNFRNNAYKDNVQKTVAITNGYNFADISILDTDPDNHAYNNFENSGVASHPSDFGMVNIANILFYNIINSDLYKKLK